MSKQEIVQQLTVLLQQQLTTMSAAAKAAHAASTGEQAKAEGKYDTRGLEASYLADAQAEQCQKLTHSLHVFQSFAVEDLPEGAAVEAGAIVETELDGVISYYFLTPCAGGNTIPYEDCELTTVSAESQLYQKLLGRKTGDILDTPELVILSII